jgi:hypothetical protein
MIFVSLAALAAAPTAARAQLKVSPPTIQLSAQAGGFKTYSTFGDITSDYQLLGNPDVLEHAEGSLLNVGSPLVPYLFSEADASGPFSGARAESSIIYQIQYSGPQNIGLPIIVHVGGLSTTVTRSGGGTGSVANSTAYMTISNNDASFNNTYAFSASYSAHATDQFGSPFDSGNNFLTDTPLITRANVDLLTITMDTITNASSSINFTGRANAQLDPLVYIDPSFPDASLYSIQISEGVANGDAPEPGTFFTFALALVGVSGRRRGSRV